MKRLASADPEGNQYRNARQRDHDCPTENLIDRVVNNVVECFPSPNLENF